MKNKHHLTYEPITTPEERIARALEVLLSDAIGESVIDFQQLPGETLKQKANPSRTEVGE